MRLIGRYELRDRIGEGAMAEVFRAYDPSIDRVLAIKFLKEEYRASEECSTRFLREAKAAGALSHPSIVTIYDVGEADGFPYIAMELLEGEPLDQALARAGKLPTDVVLAIGSQLASALSYAHKSGVVHRDIKPSNIMLAPDGTSIKILDFGIARVIDADPSQAASAHLRTQVGQVLGTPRYMSPEQALGREIDGRSDLFSVGAVLYELITGKHAFDGKSAATLALQITQQSPPALVQTAPDCPGGLRFIVEKLLAKRPDRRFLNGAELAKALKRETNAFEAVRADSASRRGYLPLQVRLTLAIVIVTALALIASITSVLDRQYAAMERMALMSGSSIASFVATNAAMPSVENAGVAPGEQDWMPVQAFIAAASKDGSVHWMTMVDRDGVIRGSSNPSLLGSRYTPPRGETVVRRSADATVTEMKLANGQQGFRFVHPILYAGRSFGTIEVSISKAGLLAAYATSRALLIGLGLVILLVVAGVSFIMAKLLAQPVRRLKLAIRDATVGNLDFRLSHGRKDEFGELFDAFNLFVETMQERLESAERGAGGMPRSLEATQVGIPVKPPAAPEAKSTPADTPFDREWLKRA